MKHPNAQERVIDAMVSIVDAQLALASAEAKRSGYTLRVLSRPDLVNVRAFLESFRGEARHKEI